MDHCKKSQSPKTESSIYELKWLKRHLLVLESDNEQEKQSIFFRIQNENGKIQSISPYSVRIRENTARKTPNTETFHVRCATIVKMLQSRLPSTKWHWLMLRRISYFFQKSTEYFCIANKLHKSRCNFKRHYHAENVTLKWKKFFENHRDEF